MPKTKSKNSNEWIYWIIAEASFFATIYYIQYLLNIDVNLWVSSLILWILINISILVCPFLKKCCN